MRVADYLMSAQLDAGRLTDAASSAGLGAVVPTCPEWTVGDLVRHIGAMTGGVTSYVTTGNPRPPTETDIRAWFADLPADDDVVPWYLRIDAGLRTAMAAADPATTCFTFLPAPSPLAFWARRHAHETTIHRGDVERAAGMAVTPVAPEFAVDGIGELMSYFTRPGTNLVADTAVTLRFTARDTGDVWTVRVERDRSALVDDPADCTVAGDANDLYLMLWNRGGTGRLDISGDASALNLWRDRAQWRFDGP